MLRLAPTLSAAALLAVVLAAVAPVGAAVVLKIVSPRDRIAVRLDDSRPAKLGDSVAKAAPAKTWLRPYTVAQKTGG